MESKTVKQINQTEVEPLLRSTNGKIFSVKFVKVDGNVRSMLCRFGVKSYLHGGKSTTGPEYLNVFDMQFQQYRKISPVRVIEFTFGGVNYVVTPPPKPAIKVV